MIAKKQYSTGLASIRLTLFLVIGIVCITSLLFVIYKRTTALSGSPAYFFISNVNSRHAAVSFVTPKKEKLCVIAYSLWPPSFFRSCERAASRSHTIQLSGLFTNTTYRVLIGRGIHWTSKYVEPIGGVINDSSYTQNLLPGFKTDSKNIVIDRNASIILGNIINVAGNPELNAVVIVKSNDGLMAVSGKTNIQGRFALSLDQRFTDNAQTPDIQLAIFGDSGYFIVSQPLGAVVNQIQTIKLTPYQ